MPSIGRLSNYKEPLDILDEVRCDSGIEEGSEISLFYDPMICKLVTYGKDRETALKNMTVALDNYVIRGVTNNIALLRDIVTEKNFVEGSITTKYLNQVYPDGFKGKQLSTHEKESLASIAASLYVKNILRSHLLKNDSRLVEEDLPKNFELVVSHAGADYHCLVSKTNKNQNFQVTINGQQHYSVADSFSLNAFVINTQINNKENLTLQLISRDDGGDMQLQYLGTRFNLKVSTKNAFEKQKYMPVKQKVDLSSKIISPMPGIVKSIAAQVGAQVAEGHEICVVEAMKMQNRLVASRNGKIKSINVKIGDTVEEGKILVELE